MKYRIAYLSTYYENIGDDFIRLGISYLMDTVYKSNCSETHFSKSNNLSFYFSKHKFSHAPRWQMGKLRRRINDKLFFLLIRVGFEKAFYHRVQNSDVIVFAGTPLFFFNKDKFTFLKNMDWPNQFFDKILKWFPEKKIWALGVGSIYEGKPEKLKINNIDEINFINKFDKACELLIVRDLKTKQLFEVAKGNGTEVKYLSCPSIFAARKYGITRSDTTRTKRKTVVLSYSEESANIDNDKTNALKCRQNALKHVYDFLVKENYEIIFFAHNKVDRDLHKSLKKEYPKAICLKGTSKDFLKLVAKVEMLVAWRVHGAMGAASVGCPAILLKTDSRAATTDIFGLTVLDDRVNNSQEIVDAMKSEIDKGYIIKHDYVQIVDQLQEKYLLEICKVKDELKV